MICIDKVLSEKEIDDLVNEIIKIPVEKNNNNCLSSYGSINVDDLIETVKELKKVPTYNELLKENQKLKKQLKDLLNQQKEFIKWLEDRLCLMDIISEAEDENDRHYALIRRTAYKEILSKYNEIIGGKNEKINVL